MLWILFVMGTIVAIVVAVIVGGLATPRDHTAGRSIVVPGTPDRVWSVARGVEHYADWRHELEDVAVVTDDPNQIRWREISTRGSLTFGITTDEPPHRFVARILDEDLPFSGEWVWELTTEGDDTRVTITERGRISNPVFRFLRAYVLGHTRSIDSYLRALATHLGVPHATIVDSPRA